MSDPIGAAVTYGATSGMADIVARISALDARLRAIDPGWQGLSAGVAGSSDGSAFANVLSSESTLSGGATLGVLATSATGSAAQTGLALVEPVVGARVSQVFGPSSLGLEPAAVVDGVHYAHYHTGLDLAAPLGTTVRAAAAGVVTLAGRQADGAVDVMIRHADGSETLYGHLQADLAVRKGDLVDAGQTIGAVGLTGMTTGPHLHFELRVNGTAIDPAPALASGRLPGVAPAAGVDPAASGTASATDLAAFDAVATTIPYAAPIRAAAVAAGVDPLLLASLVRAESGFRADAVSSAGALGLAQLMPANVRSLGVTDAFDPAQNVTAAARYLANNLRLYGRTDLALAAYQAGKGAVAQAGGIPSSPTTHHYIDRILGFWSGYLDSGQQAGTKGAAA